MLNSIARFLLSLYQFVAASIIFEKLLRTAAAAAAVGKLDW